MGETQTRRRHADKVKFGWNYLSRRRSLFQNVRRRKSCCRHSSWTPAAKRHQTTPSLLLFIYFILFFLTPVLNSQGMKKNYAMQYKKVQKSSWNKTYSSSSSFTKQSCSKMPPAPSVQHRKEK